MEVNLINSLFKGRTDVFAIHWQKVAKRVVICQLLARALICIGSINEKRFIQK